MSQASYERTQRHTEARIHKNWFRPEPIDIIPIQVYERIPHVRDVYDWMREEMGKRGWTCHHTDREVGIPLTSTSQRMNGSRRFTTKAAITYADAFGADIETVLALPGVVKPRRQR